MKYLFLLLFTTLLFSAKAQKNSAVANERMDSFMKDRFGMFIHWGPVTLRGTEIGWSRGEQVSMADYDSLYKEFNPTLFNADEWVKTAKDAGMKYLVLVAKHHDGFCLWPTTYSDLNIMHTPYKKDVVGEVAKACRKQGIRFCIYFTVLDWHDADYPVHRMGKDTKGNMPVFVQRMKDELKEIITKYKPEILWFDGYWEAPWTSDYGRDVYRFIKSIDPQILINNRLGKDYSSLTAKDAVGDFMTPEQTIGKLNMSEPWESCITIGKQWSWKPNDSIKTVKECIQTLARSACGNGNLLLNIGPMMDGRIEARQAHQLKEMGTWLKHNGESIYATKGGPYIPNEVYGTTRKGKLIYVHIFERKQDTLLLAPLAQVTIKKAYFLNGTNISFVQNEQGILIRLPVVLPDENDSVIVLETNTATETLDVVQIR
jgi:alpha-L-fucosidase